MRRAIFLQTGFFIFAFHFGTHAQDFLSSQYYSNLPVVNPGFTGIEDFTDVKLSAYQGWNSFNIRNNNGYVSVFSSLNNSQQITIKNNALRLSTTAYKQMESQKELRRKHGMGGVVSSRNVGPYRSFSVNFQYAFHLPLSSSVNLSLGTRIGYTNQRIDVTGFTVRDEINDLFFRQLVNASNGSQNSYTTDFGLLLYSKKFYVGLSSTNLVKGKLSNDGILNFVDTRRFQFHSTGVLSIGANLQLNVGGYVFLQEGYDFAWAGNLRARYKEILYTGVAYSQNSQVSLLFGLSISTTVNLHYSYDQYLSALSNFNVNAHEIVLGFSISNRAKSQPKFW